MNLLLAGLWQRLLLVLLAWLILGGVYVWAVG